MVNDFKGYSLTLSSGDNWFLSGKGELVPWVDEFARIMELHECEPEGYPKMVFTGMHPGTEGRENFREIMSCLRPDLPEKDWVCLDNSSIRVWSHSLGTDVICETRGNEIHEIEIINMWNALQPVYQRVQNNGGLPLHAALAELNRQGVLLVAPGDTGKSTCSRRLPGYWKPLCDDEALIVLNDRKEYQVHPFPSWSDYLWKRQRNTWNVQYSVPLSALFFLEQSERDEVAPVTEGQAAVLINESAHQVCRKFWRRLGKEQKRLLIQQVFDNSCIMAKTIPAFILRVSFTGCFWEKMEKVLLNL